FITFENEEDMINASTTKLILDNHQLEWISSNTKTFYYCHSSTHTISKCPTKPINYNKNERNNNMPNSSQLKELNDETELDENSSYTFDTINKYNSNLQSNYNLQNNKEKPSYAQAVKQNYKKYNNNFNNRFNEIENQIATITTKCNNFIDKINKSFNEHIVNLETPSVDSINNNMEHKLNILQINVNNIDSTFDNLSFLLER
ncbi:5016_t:CDS:1, partial [Ambispora gerdemannii]